MWYKRLRIYKFIFGILLLAFIAFYTWTLFMYLDLVDNNLLRYNVLILIGASILLLIGYFPILSYIEKKAIEENHLFNKSNCKQEKYKWQIIFKIDLTIATISCALCTIDLFLAVIVATITRDCPESLVYILLISLMVTIFTTIPLHWLNKKAIREKY